MRTMILLFLYCLAIHDLSGQERTYREYATQEVNTRLMEDYSKYAENRHLVEAHLERFENAVAGAEPVRIPLVFHIVKSSQSKKTGLLQIREQVNVLNKCFASASGQAGTGISFILAGEGDGQGRTEAIFHYPSGRNEWGTDDSVKHSSSGGADVLFPAKCLNIWVCDLEGPVSGYAQMPGGPEDTDGIVIDRAFFGLDNYENPYYNGGKTLVHLVGNYLNLNDLWGPETCSDDGVDDTPIHNTPTRGCPTCLMYSGCSGKKKMMIGNYMDNTDDACLNSFTRGQVERMRFTLSEDGPREELGRGPLPEELLEQISNTAIVQSEEGPVFSIRVFPNPTDQLANLLVISSAEDEVVITVHNTLGSIVYSSDGFISKGKSQFKIDCNGWAEGPYYLTVRSQGSSRSKLLIITNH